MKYTMIDGAWFPLCICAGGCHRQFDHIEHGQNPCWCLHCWLDAYELRRAAA